MYVLVDKLSSFDRFTVPYEESAYHLYGKTILDILDKLGIYLLSILKANWLF